MLLKSKAIRPIKSDIDLVCIRCLLRLTRNNVPRRHFKSSSPQNGAISSNSRFGKLLRREYFSANSSLGLSGFQLREPVLSHGSAGSKDATLFENATPMLGSQPLSGLTNDASEPPHRRRKRLKAEANGEVPLPLDASSRLSTLSSTMPAASLRRLFTTCLSLSKPRLSFLIVLTTATAYSLYPVPALLLPATTAAPSLSALTLVFLTAGTSLCCASANALNMLLEPKFDAQMSRTRNRPLVRGLIGKKGALIFASVAGVLGVGSLWFGVNPTTAFLGGLNIAISRGCSV